MSPNETASATVPPRRKLILVDSDARTVPDPPAPVSNGRRKEYLPGYEPGKTLRASDGTLYRVDDNGAFRRISPKPLSKKDRRKARTR